jgi:hypothetical protein
MTGQAVFFNRGMLKKIRSSLVGMTAPALDVHRFMLDHGVALGSVRIVAARAGDFAFHDGMMGGFVDLHPHLLMATDAGFIFKLAFGRSEGTDGRIAFRNSYRRGARRCRVHSVAIIAADIVARVPSGFPEREMAVAGMTAHADPGLLLRRYRAFAETDRMFVGRRIIDVIFADSVAACACLALSCGGCRVSLGPMFGIHYTRLIFMAG